MTYVLNAIILFIKSSGMVKYRLKTRALKLEFVIKNFILAAIHSYIFIYMRGVWKGVLSNENSWFTLF